MTTEPHIVDRSRLLSCVAFAFAAVLAFAFLVVLNLGLSFKYAMPKDPSDLDALRRERSSAANERLDWRSAREVLDSCRDAGCKPFINPAEKDVDIQPVRPVSVRPNSQLVYCNEVGKWKFIQSDRYGFNNRDIARFDRSEILLLGDSFGTGACVSDAQSIAFRIEEATDLKVLNLSVGGHQPIDELAVLKEYGSSHETLVWLFFEGNDAAKATDHRQMLPYLKDDFSQNLRDREVEINVAFDKLETVYAPTSDKSTPPRPPAIARQMLNRLWELVSAFFSPTISFIKSVGSQHIEFDSALYGSILKEGRRISSAAGGKRFIVVYLPCWERFVWKPSNHPNLLAFDELRLSVKQISESAGFEFVDTVPAIGANSRGTMFPYDTHAHYTADGYAVVSRRINEVLKK